MADVTGPIRSLPGSYHAVPKGQTCDGELIQHLFPVTATRRIQGETDSFGSEMFDCCEACFAVYKQQVQAAKEEEPTRTCDWCKTSGVEVVPTRDYEEGMSGRVYDVCRACRKKQNDDIQEELDRYDSGDYRY